MHHFIAIVVGLLLPFLLKSQNSTELTIGDKLPFIEIMNTVNYPKASIKFSDFKGKIVIIDFWGTYCGPCLATLFKLDSLQKKYNDKLQVITVTQFDTKEKVTNTINRYAKGRTMQLPVVVSDTQLVKYFPHQLVSHLVWIDENGIVKAITGGEYATEENLLSIISGQKNNWPIKKDIIGYDNSKPFLDFAQKEIVQPSFIYSSAFTGAMNNVSPPNGRSEDTVKKTATITFYNLSLLYFCKMAMDYPTGGKIKNPILVVRDSTRYLKKDNQYYSEWARKNLYCYSITLPITVSQKELQQIIKEDILRWLNILGIYVKKEERLVECLSLVRIIKDDKLLTSNQKDYKYELDEIANRKHLQYSSIVNLVEYLNAIDGLPRVIDDTGIAKDMKIDMQFKNNSFSDIQSLKKELSRYGLDIILYEKKDEVYVIIEK